MSSLLILQALLHLQLQNSIRQYHNPHHHCRLIITNINVTVIMCHHLLQNQRKLDQGAVGMSDLLGPLQLALKPNSVSSINCPLLNFYARRSVVPSQVYPSQYWTVFVKRNLIMEKRGPKRGTLEGKRG